MSKSNISPRTADILRMATAPVNQMLRYQMVEAITRPAPTTVPTPTRGTLIGTEPPSFTSNVAPETPAEKAKRLSRERNARYRAKKKTEDARFRSEIEAEIRKNTTPP